MAGCADGGGVHCHGYVCGDLSEPDLLRRYGDSGEASWSTLGAVAVAESVRQWNQMLPNMVRMFRGPDDHSMMLDEWPALILPPQARDNDTAYVTTMRVDVHCTVVVGTCIGVSTGIIMSSH